MENNSSHQNEVINRDTKIKILLSEYEAIERMHSHYDVLNMSMTAFIIAGVFAMWGIIFQTAFQSSLPIENSLFVNSISILALTMFLVLSVWIRYVTIHRCIVIQKLNRSHEIECILRMKQNLIFQYKVERLRAPIDSDIAKRRPGGHTLELLLYFAMSTLGGVTSLVFQWHINTQWTYKNLLIVIVLILSPILAVLWMSFCKLAVVATIKGKVEVGFPWNLLFIFTEPINRFIRWLINLNPIRY